MNIITGIKINELIYESTHTSIYEGLRISDNVNVIIKILSKEHFTKEEKNRFDHEYDVISKLNHDEIIKCYGYKKLGNSPVMILENFNGVSLDRVHAIRKFSIFESLDIAIRITGAIGYLHDNGIIHNRINLSNILWNEKTGHIKLIDFAYSTTLTGESIMIRSSGKIDSVLPFISPEQTGRMNRVIDHRTDFYSLGVILYLMLTGKMPFESKEMLELIYSHIAKMPPSPDLINPLIPKQLSAIVMKLLSKTAENRYNSAFGLEMDLKKCLQMLQDGGKIPEFIIGIHDVSDRFTISDNLYGRQNEVDAIFSILNRVNSGFKTMILVAGEAGIGKSSLVNEINKKIPENNGFFISGKFDALEKNYPYLSLILAFRELIMQILNEGNEKIGIWRIKLIHALGHNGQVIADLIPEIELIIGIQPKVQELGPVESDNRFKIVFENFVRVFADKDHPLVIFLDDLHWADSGSLNLIKLLMTNREISHLLLIGAYRDDNPDLLMTLMAAINEINEIKEIKKNDRSRAMVEFMEVKPFDLAATNDLISDSLKKNKTETIPLSKIVAGKTGGNPFFMKHFLKSLYDEKLIYFNRKKKTWNWQIDKIEKREITSNVVDFLIKKIGGYSSNIQRLLNFAACSGIKFNLEILSLIDERPDQSIKDDLYRVVKDGLISHTGEEYKFMHDRVHQAAYELLADKKKKEFHIMIGKYCLKTFSEKKIEKNIFEIVNQFNLGLDIIHEKEDIIKIAELNYSAGLKAKSSNALESAIIYFIKCQTLLRNISYEEDCLLNYKINVSMAECMYLTGSLDDAVKLFENALITAPTDDAKGEIYKRMTVMYNSKGDLVKSVQYGIMGLKILNVNIPEDGDGISLSVQKELKRIDGIIGRIGIDEIENLPQINDSSILIITEICSGMLPAAYMLGKFDLYSLLSLMMARLSLENGNSHLSSYAYTMYGVILLTIFNDYKKAYRMGELSIRIGKKYDDPSADCKTYFTISTFISPWINHFKVSVEYLNNAYQKGIDSGDILFASYSLINSFEFQLFAGFNIEAVYNSMLNYLPFIMKTNDMISINAFNIFIQFARNLKGLTKEKTSMSDDDYDENLSAEKLKESNVITVYNYYLLFKLKILYLNKCYNEALDFIEEMDLYKIGETGNIVQCMFIFYKSLVYSAIYKSQDDDRKKDIKNMLREYIEKMNAWAENNQLNFGSLYFLMCAEMAGIEEKTVEAMDLYDKSIDSAVENEFPHIAGIASESASRFYSSISKGLISDAYMKSAWKYFYEWGAVSLINDNTEIGSDNIKNYTKDIAGHSEAMIISDIFDLESIINASHAISGEIELSRVLTKIIKIATMNAGAEKGFLILQKDKKMVIEASIELGSDTAAVLQSIPVENSGNLSASIVQYVASTGENIILGNASGKGLFVNDLYIKKNRPLSVLCMPVSNKETINGVLYLENNLVENAFTNDRVDILRIIIAQAVISLDNSRMYQKMVEINKNLQNEIYIRQQTESALHKSEDRYKNLIETMHEGIYVLDKDGYFSYMNPRLCGILGYKQDELLTMNIFEFFEDINRDILSMKLLKKIDDKSMGYEAVWLSKDNKRIITMVSPQAIYDDAGNFNGSFALVTDVSEQKKAEEEKEKIENQLKQSQKLETIGTLAGGIAHDFNNILSVIFGYTELGLRSLPVNDRARQFFKDIYEAANRAAGLTSQILALSRQNKYEPKSIDAIPIIRETIKLLRAAIPASIKINSDIRIESMNIMADPTHIHQIIMNLCMNAAHAIPEKGGIIKVLVDCPDSGIISEMKKLSAKKHLMIEITDSGHGILPEIIDKIFDPFFTTKRKGEGTGLGLSVTNGIIKNYGGEIRVSSMLGIGTTFRVFLPAEETAEYDVNGFNNNSIPTGTENILIIDDEAPLALLLKEILEKLGYAIVTSTDSLEALEVFKTCSEKFDLIITDYNMPNLNGLDLAKEIKNIKPKIPIILCTGYSEKFDRKKPKDVGVDDFIYKPILIKNIAETVRRVLDSIN